MTCFRSTFSIGPRHCAVLSLLAIALGLAATTGCTGDDTGVLPVGQSKGRDDAGARGPRGAADDDEPADDDEADVAADDDGDDVSDDDAPDDDDGTDDDGADDDVLPDDDLTDDDVVTDDDMVADDDVVTDDDAEPEPEPSDDDAPTMAVCGDSILEADENCDDGNAIAGDGCSNECQLEPGWACGAAGAACGEQCGDDRVIGREQCDDGNVAAGDGCAADCRLEAGPGCGDGVLDTAAAEQCDDANTADGDGCAANCTVETVPTCGDGQRDPGEGCDDGNTMDGDGCGANCQAEVAQGDCRPADDAASGAMRVPIVYRDFYGVGSPDSTVAPNPSGHADFENEEFSRNAPRYAVVSSLGYSFSDVAGPTLGLVNTELGQGATGELATKPTFASAGSPSQINTGTLFHQWYVDTPGVNVTLAETLSIAGSGTTFSYESTTFYPLDGRGLAASAEAPGPEPQRPVDWLGYGCGERGADGNWVDMTSSITHNYSFTTELRFPFQYQGGERLVFSGDDDAWVFINGRLVIDLGGVHERYAGNLCGAVWSAIESEPACAGLGASSTGLDGVPLDLVLGEIYELAVFHAERHTCSSNYGLTLTNFVRMVGDCE